MKKINSLLEQYKFSWKMLSISMPISAVVFFVFGIILSVINGKFLWWGLVIGLAIALMIIIIYIFIRKYMLRKIAELEQQEQDRQTQSNGD